ncbi:MAG: asparagine synthetase B, partial [Flavobacteriaceae bacterium]|nr:asparagine synthetase B [Flavobacteriaceae bacterium]
MCGIVGSLNGNGQLDKAVLSSIRHRGPDTEGVLTWKNISLGHVRLSIVDLSEAGNQPMESECGKYALIFNGEIYNHDHLRKKLSNIRFRGHSDTETILYFLREFGIEGIKELNGIFAFAFLDKVKNKLYLSRDPFGVKPLYYYEKKGFLSAFASEIRGLEALGIKKELEVSQIESYLKLRYCPAPITLFHNIKKVRPGTVMELNGADGHVLNEILYTRVSEVPLSITSDEALEEYDRLLHNAVKRQLM